MQNNMEIKYIKNDSISIDSNIITFKIEASSSTKFNEFILTLDECTNLRNIYSGDIENHDIFLDESLATINTSNIQDEYSITIESDVLENIDNNIKYIQFIIEDTVYIGIYCDYEYISMQEIKMLKYYFCDILEDKQMILLLKIATNKQLLKQAIYTKHYQEALYIYLRICGMLKIFVKKYVHDYDDEYDVSDDDNEYYVNVSPEYIFLMPGNNFMDNVFVMSNVDWNVN